jgi:hypothetical protein
MRPLGLHEGFEMHHPLSFTWHENYCHHTAKWCKKKKAGPQNENRQIKGLNNTLPVYSRH